MRYVSLTPEERRQMLEAIGVDRVEDLFQCIPDHLRLRQSLDVPEPMAENVLLRYLASLAQKNASTDRHSCFLGAGAYNHFVPTVIDSIISRSEFYTAYTPYQPEISQGTLQALFEYQTLVCQLTGMDVANASLYDGSSAVAEAVLMAMRVTRRKRVVVSSALHPYYRRVLETYVAHSGLQIVTVPFSARTGRLDLTALDEALGDDSAATVVQSPNFLGVIEDLQPLSSRSKSKGALTIAVVTDAVSLGLLRAPGELGADIVAGEGQALGIPLGFGGPYLGLFATRDDFKRQMPGRLAGQTVDGEGRRGFVLTLSTREQHIRREKATSNICTNQGLCALMAAVFMTCLGRVGLREMAEQNVKKAAYLRRLLASHLVFDAPCFNEFVVRCTGDPVELNRRLAQRGIIGGLPLGRFFPERMNEMLICVTEQNTRAEIDDFARFFLENNA